jgi:hypothetical protein
MKLAFTGTSQIPSMVMVSLDRPIHLKFDALLNYACREMYYRFNFGYDGDEAFHDYIRNWARTKSPNIFLSNLVDNVVGNSTKNIVVSDLRHANEATALRALDFVLVNVEQNVQGFNQWDFTIKTCDISTHQEWQAETLLAMANAGEHLKYPRRPIQIP